jgi:mycoredoxin
VILPSPGSVSAADGARAAADGRVVVYFRRHCLHCERLRTTLGRDRRKAVWVDIWADPDAAAYVRSVNNGDETVPTVVIDGTAHTNPAPAMVKRALRTP